jgi:hypothetical protein
MDVQQRTSQHSPGWIYTDAEVGDGCLVPPLLAAARNGRITPTTHNLGEGAMHIKPNDSHELSPVLPHEHGSQWATRQLRIRAHSATGRVARAAIYKLELTAHRIRTACPPHRAPGTPCPGWALHTPTERRSVLAE